MHIHTQVHTLWDTHLVVCLETCSCWHCTEPRPPGRRLVHSPSPESEREGEGGGRKEEGELLYKAHKACVIHRPSHTNEQYLTSNSFWKPVVSVSPATCLIISLMTTLMSAATMSVSPHTTSSLRESWMNTYWACIHKHPSILHIICSDIRPDSVHEGVFM